MNNIVLFIFLTVLNLLLASALFLLALEMRKGDFKAGAVMIFTLMVTSTLFIEYLLIGGLMQ